MTYLPPPPPPPGQPGQPGQPDPQFGGGYNPPPPPPAGQQPTQNLPPYSGQAYPGYGNPTDPNAGYGGGTDPGYGQQPPPPPGYPPVPPGAAPGAPPPQGGGPSAKTWIIIGAILVVLAGGGVAAWALTGNDAKKTPTADNALTTPAPTGLGSASSTATDFPSDVPSATPTDLPSDVPTDLPSGLPSDIPTSADSALAYLTATRLALAFQVHSLDQVKEVACKGTTVKLTQADLDTVESAQVKGMPDVQGSAGKASIAIGFNDGTSDDLAVNLAKQSGDWCVDSF